LLATVRGDVAESHDLFARAASILRTTHDDRLPIFLFDVVDRPGEAVAVEVLAASVVDRGRRGSA
jgi:hypothetical protein